MLKRDMALLEEPERMYAPAASRVGFASSGGAGPAGTLGRPVAEEFPSSYSGDEGRPARRPAALKVKLRTRLPTSMIGRVATAVALLLLVSAGVGLLLVTRTFLLHDSRFMIGSESAIEVEGQKHLSRAEIVNLFREDVGDNIFRISLAERQGELEALPWVRHATVMRLLPGRIRVSIAERTPVAFARQGGRIAMVDAGGVLLDMRYAGGTAQPDPHYSFPVVTGLAAADPLAARAARMKLFANFVADLDASGEKVSATLSEVDLSDPEDVKALLPMETSDVLVHFGADHFLERYRAFREHLAEWHKLYPQLAAVDMRYEREVVLETAKMEPAAAGAKKVAAGSGAKPVAIGKAHPSAKAIPPAIHAALAVPPRPQAVTRGVATAARAPLTGSSAGGSTAARTAYLAKPAAGKTAAPIDVYHPPQVPVR